MSKPDITLIKNTPDDALLTPIEAGRLLGFTGTGILKKIKRGDIKAHCVSGKWWVQGSEIKNQVKGN